jgi:hypothetical protein
MRAGAGVVVHDIGFAEPVIRLCEQAAHSSWIRRVDGEGLSAYFRCERRQLLGIARRQSDAKADRCEPSRERRADARTCPDDQGDTIGDFRHDDLLGGFSRDCNRPGNGIKRMRT